MNYALVENGVVANLIWLDERNASDFPNAIKLGNLPVIIGDGYDEGVFVRDGEVIQTELEAMSEYANNLSAEYVDLAYQNALLQLGL